ncbi:putative peptidyl-tRNA hydrolase PTRHD1 [Varroa jacobsoni]|uniref:peptidyl-tRNA hydrolase n=1 Tax=Varroa destructor TaxID=109461 RepID=A0A7M7K6W4_VARDE|nr:putative peptidyl-tRNA hydrolase PTRHD1 [Varroa destructor]XP_022686896.1 putative peptidyl-tRNA hydrolase PTRHD1 [Varroa jacobsoni]
MASTVQYVLVRSDLLDDLKWPIGAVIAQACHASTAALYLFRDDENTRKYTDNLDSMHKVVLACPSERELRAIHLKLTAASISHKLWMEQPEDIATALATKPYPKAEIASFFKHLKLYK